MATKATRSKVKRPPLNFKGRLITQEDFEEVIFPHFRPKSVPDYENNEKFKLLFKEFREATGMDSIDAATEVGKMMGEQQGRAEPFSKFSVLAWLKPRETQSGANLNDENFAAFLAAFEVWKKRHHGKHAS
jgi:hypothetical protein